MDTLPPHRLLWVILIVLFSFCILFTCVHQATIVISDARLKMLSEEGNKKAKRLIKFLDGNSKAFAGAMQFVSSVLLLCIGACTMLMYISPLTSFFVSIGLSGNIAFFPALVVSVLITALVYLVVGVFVPKGLAGKHSESIALSMVGLSVATTNICIPFVFIPSVVSKVILSIMGVRAGDNDDDVTEEEIRMMVDIGSESGAIDDDEKEMIHNIFEMDDKPVEDIMTHRTDAVILWINDGVDKWEDIINETNHTRYPVCGNAIDDIVGVLNSRDFYKFLLKNRHGDLHSILREPYFVPESIKADEMFSQMQNKNAHFAIVLDEYGGFRGIVTQEDLIEEIVGELYSEYDRPEEDMDIIDLGNNSWIIKGSAEIEDVSEELGIDISGEEYNTFAGLILDELGTVPADGEMPELVVERLKINVTKIFDHRIEEAVVTILPEDNNSDEGSKDIDKDKGELEKD